MKPVVVVLALWISFAVSWLLAAQWSSAPVKTVGFGRELFYRVILLAGGVIFFIPAHGYAGPLRLWWVPYETVWPLVGAIALGFLFAWWARIWLGSLWSGAVTKKPDHRVVDTGPYAIVRHPIYTGILIAVYATLALKGTIPGVIGAILMTIGFWMKAKLEENWLRQELGAQDYDAYRRHVPMLIPFGPKTK